MSLKFLLISFFLIGISEMKQCLKTLNDPDINDFLSKIKLSNETIGNESTFSKKFIKFIKQVKEIMKPPYLNRTLIICVSTYGTSYSLSLIMIWIPEIFERFAMFEEKYPNMTASVCLVSEKLYSTNATLIVKFHEDGSITSVTTCDWNLNNTYTCIRKKYDVPENSYLTFVNDKVVFKSKDSASYHRRKIEFFNSIGHEEASCPTETSGIIAINNDNHKVQNCTFDSINGSLTIRNLDKNKCTMTINHDSNEIIIDNNSENINKIIINGNSERIIVNNRDRNIVEIIITGNSEYIQVNNRNSNVCTITIIGNNGRIDINNVMNNVNEVTVKGLRGVINTINKDELPNVNTINPLTDDEIVPAVPIASQFFYG